MPCRCCEGCGCCAGYHYTDGFWTRAWYVLINGIQQRICPDPSYPYEPGFCQETGILYYDFDACRPKEPGEEGDTRCVSCCKLPPVSHYFLCFSAYTRKYRGADGIGWSNMAGVQATLYLLFDRGLQQGEYGFNSGATNPGGPYLMREYTCLASSSTSYSQADELTTDGFFASKEDVDGMGCQQQTRIPWSMSVAPEGYTSELPPSSFGSGGYGTCGDSTYYRNPYVTPGVYRFRFDSDHLKKGGGTFHLNLLLPRQICGYGSNCSPYYLSVPGWGCSNGSGLGWSGLITRTAHYGPSFDGTVEWVTDEMDGTVSDCEYNIRCCKERLRTESASYGTIQVVPYDDLETYGWIEV
jgi:hypothetical protein